MTTCYWYRRGLFRNGLLFTLIGAGYTIYSEIVELAKEMDADLVVMVSHRPELKDFLLGPNAARVVRHAECPVLVIR